MSYSLRSVPSDANGAEGHLNCPVQVLARLADRSLVCFGILALLTATAAPAKSGSPLRSLKLPKADSGCASYGLAPQAGGTRGLLIITSKCRLVTVLVCTFRSASKPKVWDCQQLSFKNAGDRRRMPYAQPMTEAYYVGACVRQNLPCKSIMDWFYSRLAASGDKIDPLSLNPPPPPPPNETQPYAAERG